MPYPIRKISIFLFSFLLLFSKTSFAQKYVKDSTIIKFSNESIRPVCFNLDSVIDKRVALSSNMLRISEKVQFVFIPIDLYYVSQQPVSTNIQQLITKDSLSDESNTLVIKQFEIKHRDGIIPASVLSAQISVYKGTRTGSKNLEGTLIYETIGRKPGKKNTVECYENLLDTWRSDFTNDLKKLSSKHSDSIYRFRKGKEYAHTNLFLSSTFSFGIDWWMFDADLGFYDPEASKRFVRHTHFFRYRNEKRFESVAMGSNATHIYYRLNPSLLADLEGKYCIGFNRWLDMDSYKHTLYDIANINASIRSGIVYSPFDKKGIKIAVGIVLDSYYIYSINLKLKPAVYCMFGINL